MERFIDSPNPGEINFRKLQDRGGEPIVPAIIIDAMNLTLLMQGYINLDAYRRTLEEGEAVFWSRAKEDSSGGIKKGKLWHKGKTSGNYLVVSCIETDCDQDSLAIYVYPLGPSCHKGTKTCFDRE